MDDGRAGWWQASDGRWYPPDTHPDPAHRAHWAPEQPPVPQFGTSLGSPPGWASASPPLSPPLSPPSGGDPAPWPDQASPWPAPGQPVPGPIPKRRTGVVAGIIVVAVLALVSVPIGAIVLIRNGDGDNAAPSETPAASDADGADSPTRRTTGDDRQGDDRRASDDASTGADATSADAGGDGLGTRERPAALGTIFDLGDGWFATIASVRDATAEGLLGEFSSEPAAGQMFLAVSADVTYAGEELTASPGIFIEALGSEVFATSFECLLDANLAPSTYNFRPGQTAPLAVCVEIPVDERASVIFALENVFDFDGEPRVFSEASTETADPPPIPASGPPSGGPPGSPGNPAALGTGFEFSAGWSASLTRVEDGVAGGLVDEFFGAPEPGNVFLVVIVEATYTGDELTGTPGIVVQALGSEVFDNAFACFLDSSVIESTFEFVPGQTGLVTFCFEVPEAERSSLVYVVGDHNDFEVEPVVFSESGA